MKGFVQDIEGLVVKNNEFRRVLYTAKHCQLVVMALKPKEEIGAEVHKLDQFFRLDYESSGPNSIGWLSNSMPQSATCWSRASRMRDRWGPAPAASLPPTMCKQQSMPRPASFQHEVTTEPIDNRLLHPMAKATKDAVEADNILRATNLAVSLTSEPSSPDPKKRPRHTGASRFTQPDLARPFREVYRG